MRKSDNPAEVGKHVFELAGLGLAPFQYTHMEEKFRTNPDGSTQATGTCDYCGTGIRYAFGIRSADGKCSVVGCDCIEKTGDAGLVRAYKSSKEFRKLQADKRAAKAASDLSECKAIMAANEAALKAVLFPSTRHVESFWAKATWLLNNSGAAGRKNLLHFLRLGCVSNVSWTQAGLEAAPAEPVAVAPAAPRPVFPEVPAVSPEVREIANRLTDGMGGFRDSVARDLRDGRKLSGRALDIACDILAKQHGRAGSAAFDAQWQHAFRILAPDQCE